MRLVNFIENLVFLMDYIYYGWWSQSASNKEQIAIILRFIDIQGFLRECFFKIVHVSYTIASTLKKKKLLMCALDITCISSIYKVKGIMVLAICMTHGMNYKLYFSEIVLMHLMYITLPINYNWY